MPSRHQQPQSQTAVHAAAQQHRHTQPFAGLAAAGVGRGGAGAGRGGARRVWARRVWARRVWARVGEGARGGLELRWQLYSLAVWKGGTCVR